MPPAENAVLDISSVNQGVLIPRLSESARNSIPNPARGLMIYDSTSRCITFFNGTVWCQMASSPVTFLVGLDHPGGGISISGSQEAIADNSAILDISDAERGVLFPRTWAGQIPNPGEGLMYYDLNLNRLSYFDGTTWQTTCFTETATGGGVGSKPTIGVAISDRMEEPPHPSSILDVRAQNKGVLLPRMTTSEREQILPSEGLIIYNTTSHVLEYFDGSYWKSITRNEIVELTLLISARRVCQGDTVNVMAISSNGGPDPIYQWKVNGVGEGANNPAFSWIPENQDQVVCEVTSSLLCVLENPVQSEVITITVDNGPPGSPEVGEHVASENQISWNWINIGNSQGFKWNSTNNYATALDLGDATTFTESNLECNSHYTRFLWSYNGCSHTGPVQMTKATTTCTFICGQSVIDTRDNQQYNTVEIGAQCWMTSNLNFGLQIASESDQSDNDTVEKYCYNNQEINCDTYGGLYQWDEMMDYSRIQGTVGICPVGWHIPTASEWGVLSEYFGGDDQAGLKLKETGFTHWSLSCMDGDGTVSFNGLPAGTVFSGNFFNLGEVAQFWSSTSLASFGYKRVLGCNDDDFLEDISHRDYGHSVRCVRSIDCQVPEVPLEGAHIAYENEIIWNWDPVDGALGYKYNSTDDYSTAMDMGSSNTTTEQNLECNTEYHRYVWAYNSCGHSLTTPLIESTLACQPVPCPDMPTVTYSGQVYNTMMIGTQCWLKENLNVGVRLDIEFDQSNNEIKEKYCYDNQESNCSTYGGLYQWAEAMNYQNGASNTQMWDPLPTGKIKGLCPDGWHIPTLAEFTQLIDFLGGQDNAGDKMKEAGELHWNSGNTGTNESGFTGLGSGSQPGGSGNDLKVYTYYITSLEESNTLSWITGLISFTGSTFQSKRTKSFGQSIRCVRD